MHNGTEKRKTTALRVRTPRHKGGNDIAHRLPLRVREARQRIGAWSHALGQQVQDHPGRSIALVVGAGYLLGGGLFSRLTARALGTGLRIGFRLLVPFLAQSIVTQQLHPDKKETQP